MAFGQTVETEQQMIEALVQVILRAGDEGIDVVGVIEVGRLNLDAHFGGDVRCDFFDAHDSGFEAGHGVMREQGNEEEVVDAFLSDALDGVGDRRALIAHGKFDGDIEALLQFGLDIAAGDDEGRAGWGPDFVVSLGGLLRAGGKNGEIDDAEAGDGVYVEDAAIHEEFAEVFADVGDGWGVRRAEVEEENAFQELNKLKG